MEDEGRAGDEALCRRASDLEWVEPGGRISDADAIAEAHPEPVAHPGFTEERKCGCLHLPGFDTGLDGREPGAKAGERDPVEADAGRRCFANAERVDPDRVMLLDAADLHMNEIAEFEHAVGRRAVAEDGAWAGREPVGIDG